MKRFLGRGFWLGACGVLGTFALVWFGIQRARRTTPVVPSAPKEIVADVTGQLRAAKEYFVSVKTGGRLDTLAANEGDSVEQGAILGLMDVTDRKSRVESALSGYSLAQADLSRIRSLYRSGAATRQEFDEASSRHDIKKAELTQARQNLEDGLIRAPVKGRLAVFAFSVGDVIPDGARVAIVEDSSLFYLTGRFDSVPLKAAQSAKVRLKGLDKGELESDEIVGTLTPLSANPTGETDVRIELPSLPEGFSVRQAVRAEVKITNTETM